MGFFEEPHERRVTRGRDTLLTETIERDRSMQAPRAGHRDPIRIDVNLDRRAPRLRAQISMRQRVDDRLAQGFIR